MPNLLPTGAGGHSLSELYLLINPARLNLKGTGVPAGVAAGLLSYTSLTTMIR